VHLLLSGHHHRALSGHIADIGAAGSVLVVHAGTAVSTRIRGGEANSYNLICVDGQRVSFADEQSAAIDAVIWATGYRPDYWFVNAPIMGVDGWPEEVRGVSPTVPGLYFLGIPFQYAFSSMNIVGAGRDAKYVVDRVAERVAAQATRPVAEAAAA